MAKKKNKKQNQPTPKAFTPEQYLRTKARQLPIYKCYKSTIPGDTRQMAVVVARQHPQGTITFAAFMLDRWCLGVKNVLWQFNVDESYLDHCLSYLRKGDQKLEEISYVEAHNWVYGAHDWAADAGIMPHPDFAIASYVLEADDDDVELIEYDFGNDGEYWLMVHNNFEASQYIPTLTKTLGTGNFNIVIDDDEEDDFDDEDYDFDDDEEDDLFGGFKVTPSMEYTYEGKDYPTTAVLHHEELWDIMTKELFQVTDEQIETVLALPADTLREDLHALLMQQIGLQWRKENYSVEEDGGINYNVTINALAFLTHVATIDDSLPIILEVLRQSPEYIDNNFGDIPDRFLYPMLYLLAKDDPSVFLPFLLEEGPCYRAKFCVLELFETMADNMPELHDDFLSLSKTILEAYRDDLPQRTICDGTVTAFAFGIPFALKATELLPIVEELYSTGLIDESVNGHIDEVRRLFKDGGTHYDLPPTDVYGIREAYRRFIRFNERFEKGI